MGQTLTHGIYLPDEGERNCYNGLAANWQLLDGAVGTIAEHTTALSGKAPLVHTHVKADITDLFNSANTWSGDNTFSGSNSFNSGLTINNAALLNAVLQNAVKGDVSTTGDFGIFIKDKVNGNAATSLLAVYRGGQDSGGSYAQINIDTKGNDNNRYNNSILFRINPADNSNNAVLIPQRDKTIDLGTSSNQWKSVYAQSYYYNGVAWGLDKENHWTNNNTFDTTIIVKSLTQEIGVTPSVSRYTYCDFRDKNEISISQVITEQFANGYDTISLNMYNKYTNGVKDPDGTSVNAKFEVGLTPTGNPYVNTNSKWLCNLTPIVAGLNLGTSTNKWKSFNGINPGALSLPTTDSTKWVDLSGSIVANNSYTYTPAVDGWISVELNNTNASSPVAVFIEQSAIKAACFGYAPKVTGGNFYGSACIPVRANIAVNIYARGSNIVVSSAYFIPCEGNV